METFDLVIAWDNESDNEFVNDLNDRALKEGVKPYLIHAYNFFSSLKDITEGELSFRCFFDRSSDDSSTFGGLADFLKKKDINFINHPDNAKKSTDKFKMYFKFMNHGIPVPKTVLLRPEEDRKILEFKMKFISNSFIVKPADGSSGESVVLDAQSLDDILRLKEQFGNTTYLVQEKITPINLENKPAWFRVFYCLGKINPCWWNPLTRIYDILTIKEIYRFGLYDMW